MSKVKTRSFVCFWSKYGLCNRNSKRDGRMVCMACREDGKSDGMFYEIAIELPVSQKLSIMKSDTA